MKYDFLIVGAGLFGSVCARELTDKGYKCLVIDKRNHIAGNCYTENINDIDVHKYGPHIFHTSNENIWKYINQFSEFNNFELNIIANHKNNLYSLPFNMWTFYQLWGVKSESDAQAIIDSQKFIGTPSNLEEYALSIVGKDIYYTLIYGYTKKQWGTEPKNLPASIIKRLPIRFMFNNNYFNDKYQGIPKYGYTKIFDNLLSDSSVELGVDFFNKQEYYASNAKNIIYTGPIDKFYNFEYGELDYRSLRFEEERINTNSYQGCPVVNYTEESIKHTRITEHKHFISNHINNENTVITKEYPAQYTTATEPMYPIADIKNKELYTRYKDLTKHNKQIIFGGRLAEYKYYDMHQVIGSALSTVREILNEN
jgi:UDP-galactopyranose mutase